MKQQSRYNYETRIKELETEVNRLAPYETAVREIFQSIVESNDSSSALRIRWILSQLKRCLK